MNPRISTILLTMLSVIFLNTPGADAAIKEISFLSSDAPTRTVVEGSTFDVQVQVDNATTIAGASFTVTYDTNNLTLINTTSTFFGTFFSQGIPTDGDSGYVTVDDVPYYSPQVTALTTEGTMIAAARFDNGEGTDIDLFTLTFEVTGTADVYTISAAQSVITNTAAGYTDDLTDENNHLPYFVGIDTESTDTPYPTHTATINSCTITVIVPDNDGIDDDWEIANRPDGVGENDSDVLDFYTADGDYDRDGYSDYQEYLNRNETDSAGNDYDPAAKNAADGTGYVPIRIALPAVNLLLLDS